MTEWLKHSLLNFSSDMNIGVDVYAILVYHCLASNISKVKHLW
jgi:hypothetical protein